MKRFLLFLFAIVSAVTGFAQDDVMIIYRNDGTVNAFLKADIDSVRWSHLDLDSIYHNEYVCQEIWTSDSTYRVPVEAVDSVSFRTPPTIVKSDVVNIADELIKYVTSVDELTITLSSSTPQYLVPKVGERLLMMDDHSLFPSGFAGKVAEVANQAGGIVVVCVVTALEDIFDSYCSISSGIQDIGAPGRQSTQKIDGVFDHTFDFGEIPINYTREISKKLKEDSNLALEFDPSFVVTNHPKLNAHAFLLIDSDHGTYFSCAVTGDLTSKSQIAFTGGLDYSVDFLDKDLVKIPTNLKFVTFYVKPGLFTHLQATASFRAQTTQTYSMAMAYTYSSRGEEIVKNVPPTFKLKSRTIDEYEGTFQGAFSGGAFCEIGFNIADSHISKVCLRTELGDSISGTIALTNEDISEAEQSTKLYERLKSITIAIEAFVHSRLEAGIGSWTIDMPLPFDHTFSRAEEGIVPTFSDITIKKSADRHSADAYMKMEGTCIRPVEVGFALLNAEKETVDEIQSSDKFYSGKYALEYTFRDLEPSALYFLYPKCKVFGKWILASPFDTTAESCPDDNHPHAIDLGLPSGTKWACCNVGASAPEEYGYYFAWGETHPKNYYHWDSYMYYYDSGEIEKCMAKYCTESHYGIVDNKTELDLVDDAAYMNWGEGWRMPSHEQLTELHDNCTWITENNVYGRKVISPNGNSIFLPAAGYYIGSTHFYDDGSVGDLWSRSLYPTDSRCAYELTFTLNHVYITRFYPRYQGLSVRPVRQK